MKMNRHPTRRYRLRTTARAALGLAAAAAAVHLGAQVAAWRTVAGASIALLVPPLAVHLVASTWSVVHASASPMVRRLLVAATAGLTFCWLGDLTDAVLLKLPLFLVGHLVWCWALWHWHRDSVLARPRYRLVALGCYGAVAVMMVAVLTPHVGAMVSVMAAYAVCLTAMAVLASSLGVSGLVGGALFVVSDGLLAIDWFVRPLPLSGPIIMGPYIAALWLLTLGFARRIRAMAGKSAAVPSGRVDRVG